MTKAPSSILIVDDDDEIRELLKTLLDTSYFCLTASSAEEAITLLKTGTFDLVLSDITMPGASGLDLCRYVQQACPGTAVVVMSALTDSEVAIRAIREGAFDYVRKPFELAQLKLSVDRALRYQEALEDKRRYERALEERVRVRISELRAANEELNSLLDVLYRSYRATLRGLARTLEARDIETRGHSDRVVAYSLRLGKQMNLSSNDLIALEQGALLHDIGKIGVPDSVLLKPGVLTADEWARMREHVSHGLRIIEGVEYLAGARFVIEQHHEKYDGSGYPNKLRGDLIHIHARIFAVADAFDAIRSDRPYRAGQPYERACEEIVAGAGSHFDPAVVSAFLRVPEHEWEQIRRNASNLEYAENSVGRREISTFISSLGPSANLATQLDALCA